MHDARGALTLCDGNARSVAPDSAVRTAGIISAMATISCPGACRSTWGSPGVSCRRGVAVWKIDPFVTEQVSRALQPRCGIVPVDFDRATFLDRSL
jgi:hypothetical protein